ncbi:MAG: hypothetical protein JWQ09_2258 [Segetibacter sp.]|nr:hypothetical protein [Segetibacter sp.]
MSSDDDEKSGVSNNPPLVGFNDLSLLVTTPYYIQPSGKSKENEVLSKKCYAYAAFNALTHAKKKLNKDGTSRTQADVDTWIKKNESYSSDGGPQYIANTLKKEGVYEDLGFRQVKMGAKLILCVKMALEHNLPVCIGVSLSTTKHWIYAIAIGEISNEILVVDQQNPHYGVFALKFSKSKGNEKWEGLAKTNRTYTITQVKVGYTNATEHKLIEPYS